MDNIIKQLKDIQEKNSGDEVVNDLVNISLILLAFLSKQSNTELLMRLHQVESAVGISHREIQRDRAERAERSYRDRSITPPDTRRGYEPVWLREEYV